MKEHLQIKNFGPLKDIDMELKDFMVLIGPQGVGKSAIAKLVVIGHEYAMRSDILFLNSLEKHGIAWSNNGTIIRLNGENIFNEDKNDVLIGTSIMDVNDALVKIKADTLFFEKFYHEMDSESPNIPNWDRMYSGFQNTLNSFDQILTSKYVKKYTNVKGILQNRITTIRIKISSLVGSSKNKLTKIQAFTILDILKEIIGIVSDVKAILPFQPHYIPAERGFLPSITGLTLNLIQNRVPLAPGVLDFGATFEKARLTIPKYENPLLGITYRYESGNDKIYLKDSTGINLKDAASGYQTLIPLMLVIEYLTQDKDLGPHYFIIEEPELNLYPSTQTALVEWLVKKCKESNSKLLMTTHSPYILTAMDNLIKAGEVAKQKPEAAKEINKLVKKDYWLDFDNVGVYYINKGKAKNLMNKTNRSINATAIDDVSEGMAATFDKLLDIQYQEK